MSRFAPAETRPVDIRGINEDATVSEKQYSPEVFMRMPKVSKNAFQVVHLDIAYLFD